jgi:diadenosine tetraphosphatase ApaH/serine/threonine PP2A family protein phosphatase
MDLQVNLMGNHEEAALNIAVGFNPVARRSIEWTRSRLKLGPLSSAAKRYRWRFLQQMPRSYEKGDLLLVHGSPRDPTMEYIMKSDTDDLLGEIPEKILENLQLVRRFCFCGHSHMPGIVSDDGVFRTPAEIDGVLRVDESSKVIVNVGAVGQPRDRDPRACYVTLNDEDIRYHRVEYDFAKTIEKVKQIEALDKFNGERLAEGR